MVGVHVMGIPRNRARRSAYGLAAARPRHLGYEYDRVPLQEGSQDALSSRD